MVDPDTSLARMFLKTVELNSGLFTKGIQNLDSSIVLDDAVSEINSYRGYLEGVREYAKIKWKDVDRRIVITIKTLEKLSTAIKRAPDKVETLAFRLFVSSLDLLIAIIEALEVEVNSELHAEGNVDLLYLKAKALSEIKRIFMGLHSLLNKYQSSSGRLLKIMQAKSEILVSVFSRILMVVVDLYSLGTRKAAREGYGLISARIDDLSDVAYYEELQTNFNNIVSLARQEEILNTFPYCSNG